MAEVPPSPASQSPIDIGHADAFIRIGPFRNGLRRLEVRPRRPGLYIHRSAWETAYPDDLIRVILANKGPAYLCDEIMRDEDPQYIRTHLELTITAHVDPAEFAGQPVLDFGCGAGASTVALSRVIPGAHITGIDLNTGNLQIAERRAAFYRLQGVRFLRSPAGDEIPEGLGRFRAIVLSAVYEHLLSHERRVLLPKLWTMLEPGGVLFIDETPHRWFPVETHTTGLPFINYLPAPLALRYARACSKRLRKQESWQAMCRDGIRGGTAGEILQDLGPRSGALRLPPTRLGIRDEIDLWRRGYVFGSGMKAKAVPWIRLASSVLRHPIVPYISLAIRKSGA